MRIALHFSEKSQKNIQNLILTTLIALGFYGIYKNGISYILLGSMNWNQVISLGMFPIISTLTHIGVNLLQKKKAFTKIYEGILLGLMVPPLFPIWLFIILVALYSICKVIHLKIPLSWLLFFKILLCITSSIFKIPYENLIENTTPYSYGTLDLFLGRGVGNLGTTSIILLILLYAFLNLEFYYKKDLPLYALASFFICAFIHSLVYPEYSFILESLNSHLWFTAIVLLPSIRHSPATQKGKRIYGILYGLLSFACVSVLGFTNGFYYLLAIFQILLPIIRKVWLKHQIILYAKKM